MFFLLLTGLSAAATIVGNPNVIVETDSDSTVQLWSLTLTRCGGGVVNLPLRRDIAPQSAVDVTVPAGSFCEIEAVLHGPPSPTNLYTTTETLDVVIGESDQAVLTLSEANQALWLSIN